jgi:hypothetical protein
VTSLIAAKVNRSKELMNELHIKVTVELHELDQVKLLANLQSLSKIVKVLPPMLKIDRPHLGDLVLVMLKDFRDNPHLQIIPELRVVPARIWWRSVWVLKTNPLPILDFPFGHGQRCSLLGCNRLLPSSGSGGNHHLLIILIVGRVMAPTGPLPGLPRPLSSTRARAT